MLLPLPTPPRPTKTTALPFVVRMGPEEPVSVRPVPARAIQQSESS
jgi:hypothetical protein